MSMPNLLLNIMWLSVRYLIAVKILISLSGCSSEKSNLPSTDLKLFTKLSSEQTGVHFSNIITENEELNYFNYNYFYNGGGVAIGDINNDGLPDIFLTSNLHDDRLYLNKGNMNFIDISTRANLNISSGWSTGATFADVNNDGYLDLYVCRSGHVTAAKRRNLLYLNNGDLTFTDASKRLGLDDPSFSTQSTFFDFDRDGDLDMYLLNHPIEFFESFEKALERKEIRNPYKSDKLFRNDNGQFIDISSTAGIANYGYGLGVVVADFNNDSWPDLFVSNDFLSKDNLYINQGDGSFSDMLESLLRKSSNFGMGCDAADINNDGLIDLIQLDMAAEHHYRSKTNMSGMNPDLFWGAVKEGFHYQYMVNTLQLNNGIDFSEIGHLAGTAKTDWSWAALLADFDNDGFKDLFVTNGYKRDVRNNDGNRKYKKGQQSNFQLSNLEKLELYPSVKLSNYIFKNNRDYTFENKSVDWGLDERVNSNGAAYGDLDGDGDLDLVVNNIDDPASILRNNSSELNRGNFLRIKLLGPKKNPFGIGTKIEIRAKDQTQLVELTTSRGFQSSCENIVHFGLNNQDTIQEIKVTWPDGQQEILSNVSANKLITVNYRNSSKIKLKQSPKNTLFIDVTEKYGIKHRHEETAYDDYKNELLLPHKLSESGPRIAVGDVNGDQLDDFYIGGAMGYSGQLYLQSESHSFFKASSQPWSKHYTSEDVGVTFFDADNDKDLDLYVCSGSNEFEEGSKNYQDRLYVNDGNGIFSFKESLPEFLFSGSCITSGDYDKDGDLDLFVGGQLIPGKYPTPGQSQILNNDHGQFTNVTNGLAPGISSAGMVRDAKWTDIDNDADLDLLIVGEWMSIKVYENRNNILIDISVEAMVSSEIGWWNCIATGDYDNDGDIDFIMGNLGKNYKYKATKEKPFHIYYDDFDSNGSHDIVLGYYDQATLFPVRGRECTSQQIPEILNRFPTYESFASASLPKILGDRADSALHYEVSNFSTSYFENRGDNTFKIKPMPIEVQFSAVNRILTYDFNDDGNLDIVLAGNLYQSEVETPRADAGIGLYLKGDGHGNFLPIRVIESGFYASGDVKDLALIHLGKDREPAVLVAKNNDYLNLIKRQKVYEDSSIFNAQSKHP